VIFLIFLLFFLSHALTDNIPFASTDKTNSNNIKKITINQQKGRLSQEEIAHIVQESEKYKAEDEEKRKQIQAKNDLESFVYQMRNTLDDSKFKDLLKSDDKKKVDEAVKACLKWIEEHPTASREDYENKRKELEEMWRPIITAAYGQQDGVPNMRGDTTSGEETSNKGTIIDDVD